jgi:hypothetical protein
MELVHDVDGIEVWSVVWSGTATSASTLFPGCGVVAPGIYRMQKILASFF